ncbi:MAG: site-specific integrase, partial [Elusimicrobiota bacterium]|nr:site-specific integrase [Elusimicrobiota bacterium]
MFHRRKRGNIWYVYWQENGKQKAKAVSIDLQATKQFEIELAKRLYAKKNGLFYGNHRFDELCNDYIKNFSKINKKPRTIKKDEYVIKYFKKICKDIKYCKDFNIESINRFRSERLQSGKTQSTVNRSLQVLKSMIKYAYKKKYIYTDFSSDIKLFSIPKEAKSWVMDKKEIDILLEKTNHPYKTAFLLVLYGGLRRGEVCHLEWQDIDFEKENIYIRKKPHLNWEPKNRTSIRTVPIHPEIKNYLLDIKKLAGNKTNFVVFYKEDLRVLDEDTLTGMVRKIKIKLGLPREFCFHSLRHTFVYNMVKNGVPSYHISKIIGHSNTNITEQVYTHLKDT